MIYTFIFLVLTQWYIRSRVAGIFTVCWSSEVYQVSRSCELSCYGYQYTPTQLTNEERVAIVKRVSDKAADRVPVVAGG